MSLRWTWCFCSPYVSHVRPLGLGEPVHEGVGGLERGAGLTGLVVEDVGAGGDRGRQRCRGGRPVPGDMTGPFGEAGHRLRGAVVERDHCLAGSRARTQECSWGLLRGALAAGLTAPALAALTAARTDVDQTLSPDTPQDLADLEATAESYGYGSHGQTPTRVLADLVTDFTTLRPLLTVPQPAPVRARLCRTGGQNCGASSDHLHGRTPC
ncbi:hypothetical protein [Streptomyces cadmiisoli]|uniref:hypothetical protein n=1 Tax=Streptomyces cadmiisoli TaxID=2184053 RepID=UPI003D722443